MFDRLIKLIGEDNFNKIQNTRVLLIGVGGVGSATLETLVRNGFTKIQIIDYDTIDITNLNRQLITTSNNINKIKANEAYLRAKEINPDIELSTQNIKLTTDNLITILDSGFDYVIDACDDLDVKFELIKLSFKMDFKLIESMGTAKKLDPTKLFITTLDKTEYDPIAKILRKRCRDSRLNPKKVNVVSSKEAPINIREKATSSVVPNTAGIYLASFVINDIIKAHME